MIYQPKGFKKIFHSTRRFFARYWLSLQPVLQIAITGSHGKTNTTYVLSKILTPIGNTVATDINLDTIYNVPITALKVMPWTRFALFELGVDHPGEMDFHLQIVRPKIAIITGISPVHTDQTHLRSLIALIKEKRKLIETLPKEGCAILNYDDEHVRSMASFTKAQVLWYGTDEKKCDVWVDPKTIKVSLEGTSFKLFFRETDSTDSNRFQPISTGLIGKHHIYTIMASYLIWRIILSNLPNLPNLPNFPNLLSHISPLHGRMSVEKGPLGTLLLNDSLRANPASTKSGLETLSEINYPQGRKIAVLAEMGELQKPEEEHEKIVNLLKHLNIDYAITIGNLFPKLPQLPQSPKYPQSPQILFAKDISQAANMLKKILKKDDLIYLKGSLHRHVERVLPLSRIIIP